VKYLLDTCVISEIVKPAPAQTVTHWLDSQEDNALFISSLTIGEIQKGINKLPSTKKRTALEKWFDEYFHQYFDNRILEITPSIAARWGKIQGQTERLGKKLPIIDSFIAATAITHDLTIVTRNIKDIKYIPNIKFLDPWNL
jgi:predicted nucleic acid-binding protein